MGCVGSKQPEKEPQKSAPPAPVDPGKPDPAVQGSVVKPQTKLTEDQ